MSHLRSGGLLVEIRWWQQPRSRGRQGDFALIKGRDVRIICPGCWDDYIVYNGNYFCDSYGERCDWALPHPARKDADRAVCDLIGVDYD